MASLGDLAGTLCAAHGAEIMVRGERAMCRQGGCDTEALIAHAASLNGHVKKPPPANSDEGSRVEEDAANENHDTHLNGAAQVRQTLEQFKSNVLTVANRFLREDPEYSKPIATSLLIDPLIADVRDGLEVLYKSGLWHAPDMPRAELDEERDRVVRMALEEWAGGIDLDRALPAGQLPEIPFEDFGGALVANEEYLQRDAIVERLGYTSSVMLITGGKHAGKSTLARWMAVCVAKGWPFLKRVVKQGPVFYIASEDETMAARQELIRLGWTQDDPIWFLPASKIGEPEMFLDRLATVVKERHVVLVVLDMLFDFVRIPDEMSYSGTREALGKIQLLASLGECLVATTHHAPKYLETADAAVTALGSQGLAARVSPILLVRKHGPELHSIVSTSVRDPRGEAIAESKLIRNVDGSVVLGEGWKMWMQAEVFMPKVLELLQTEPGQELSTGDVKEALGISYQLASGALSRLYKERQIGRTGEGKKGKPFKYSADAPVEPPRYSSNPDHDR